MIMASVSVMDYVSITATVSIMTPIITMATVSVIPYVRAIKSVFCDLAFVLTPSVLTYV